MSLFEVFVGIYHWLSYQINVVLLPKKLSFIKIIETKKRWGNNKKLEIHQSLFNFALKGRWFHKFHRCFRFGWGARLELFSGLGYPMKVAVVSVGLDVVTARHPRGLLGKGGHLRWFLTKKYEKYGKRGRWNVKERFWRIFMKKKRYLISHWMFLFCFFCGSRSQELKMLLRMAYGWRMTIAESGPNVLGQIPMVFNQWCFMKVIVSSENPPWPASFRGLTRCTPKFGTRSLLPSFQREKSFGHIQKKGRCFCKASHRFSLQTTPFSWCFESPTHPPEMLRSR